MLEWRTADLHRLTAVGGDCHDAWNDTRHHSELVIILIIFLLGGFSGRFGGYGYGMGHSSMGLGGVILIVLIVLLLLGKL